MIGHFIVAGVLIIIAGLLFFITSFRRFQKIRKAANIFVILLVCIALAAGIAGYVMNEQAQKEYMLKEGRIYYLELLLDEYEDNIEPIYISMTFQEISDLYQWANGAWYENQRWGIFSKYWLLRGKKAPEYCISETF